MTPRTVPCGPHFWRTPVGIAACVMALAAGAITAGAQPMPLPAAHAHNDYEHSRPLLDALDLGFCSVEADIFLVGQELLVAHNLEDTRPGRTLQSLYLDPLRQRIRSNRGSVYLNGPPFTLLIDVKSEAEETYRALREVLKNYGDILTRFSPDGIRTNAVTAILSGNRARETLERENVRYAAMDGRLPDLETSAPLHLIPLVSDNWMTRFQWRGIGPLPPSDRDLLQSLVEKSRAQGRRLRFWGIPDIPAAWEILHSHGVDLIGTDQLAGLQQFLLARAAAPHTASLISSPLAPAPVPGLTYTNAFFPGATYDPAIPTIESLIGFPVGARAANSAEIERCLKSWAAASPRARLTEYARSHENRALYYLLVTSPQRVADLGSVQGRLRQLGDPRSLSETQIAELVASTAGVAWIAATIHGDETEGSDATLALLYHLLASTEPDTQRLLEDLIIIVDPLMNPDGRDRFLKMVAEHRGASPNIDDRAMQHQGYWPQGRGNHYLFDLNRDWILGVHPETRGRVREVASWNPLLFVDAHGMGAQETHLFSPPREPVNLHFPAHRKRWADRFAADQAKALDRHGWVYYSGEWNEGWYPGYSDSWAGLRGALDILYEQARIAEHGVVRPEGRILTYRESVHHHVAGAMANLASLQSHHREMQRDLVASRLLAADPAGPYANRTFAVLPTGNASRLRRFTEWLHAQGIELYTNSVAFMAGLAEDQLGRSITNSLVPPGALLIPNRQPLGHLIAALLEFDPHLPAAAVEDERREILRSGESRIYDTTAWNLTMMHSLPALMLPIEPPSSAVRLDPNASPPPAGLRARPQQPVAFVFDGAEDASVAAAARLMQVGIQVRVAEKPFTFDNHAFARGSVVITTLDNRPRKAELESLVTGLAHELGLPVTAVGSGLGQGDMPDLGGSHFVRLEPPRIGLFSRPGFSAYDFGTLWQTLDHRLAIRHSILDETSRDLSRYNVLVLPDGASKSLSDDSMKELKSWVEAGGTLIAIGDSAAQLAAEKPDLSKVRTLPAVLDKLPEYELAVFREWMAAHGPVPAATNLWAHDVRPGLEYPWQAIKGEGPDEKELKRRDAWAKRFMPQGAIVAGRIDARHWLTAGVDELVPIMISRDPVLMAAEGIQTAVRFGVLVPNGMNRTNATQKAAGSSKSKSGTGVDPDDDEKKSDDRRDDSKGGDGRPKKEPSRPGWSAIPEGFELRLRMSGLLWPEAAHRLANAAYLTRESRGRGQVILFASAPTFRNSMLGTTRLFLNAVVYGPGFGAAPVIRP